MCSSIISRRSINARRIRVAGRFFVSTICSLMVRRCRCRIAAITCSRWSTRRFAPALRHDSTGVVFCGYNRLVEKPKLLVLGYDIVQIEAASQLLWLQTVIERCEQYAQKCDARMGSAGVFIEQAASGVILLEMLQQYARSRGARPLAYPIESKLTSLGKDARAILAGPYLTAGLVKITQPAFEYTKRHKDFFGNQLLRQLTDYRLAAADGAADDLVDALTYSVIISLAPASQRLGPW
jgi:hypothetical protein